MRKNDLIFIIDDDPVYVSFLKFNLFKLGFTNIKTFNAGQEYLNNLYQIPKVVLMDYLLEDITGKTLLTETLTFDSDILVVMISSQKSIESAVETLKIGALDYLTKDETLQDQLRKIFKKIDHLHKENSSWFNLNVFSVLGFVAFITALVFNNLI